MQTIIRDFLQHRHKYAYFLTDSPFSSAQRAAIRPTGNYSKTRSDAPIEGNRSGFCSTISCLVYRFIIE
mgnify:FL=1